MTVERPESETVECSDGTKFSVFSEHVSGESRFYFVKRLTPGDKTKDGLDGGWRSVDFDGSNTRRTAWNAARRLARAWEEQSS